jgi:nucleotide-binding universal stress UspA family protein
MEFRSILVPVDFTVNTEIAVQKAIEMLESDNAVIYLLHVIDPLSSFGALYSVMHHAAVGIDSDRYRRQKERLQQWRIKISENTAAEVQIQTTVVKGRVEGSIIQEAKALQCELVILAKHIRQRPFPVFHLVSPDKIARLSNCAVLTVTPGSLDHRIKLIVVPVGKFVSRRKIDLLVALTNKFHAKIHLVTLKKAEGLISNDSSRALLQTYRILRGFRLLLPLEHKVIEGNNLANASLKYAQAILADIIIVNPETETRTSSFTRQHITDLLATNSKLQVLEVEP